MAKPISKALVNKFVLQAIIFVGFKSENIAISASVPQLKYVYSPARINRKEIPCGDTFTNYVVDSNFIWVIYHYFPDTFLFVRFFQEANSPDIVNLLTVV